MNTTPVSLLLCLYSSQRFQASRSILVPLCSPCLAGEGAVDLTRIQGSCGRCQQAPGLGLQQPWSLCWSQGPYCPKAISLLSVFHCPLQFWPPTFIYAEIALAVHSVPQQISPVFHLCKGEVDSAPTYLATIFLSPSFKLFNDESRVLFL